ncbi:MAG: glycosyltransferase [Gemmatimonadota bacterium]
MRVGVWHHRTVPVRKYGGTERVVVWLADALARLGHEPVLLTPPGSRSETARVVPVPPDVLERAEEDPGFHLDPHLPDDLDVLHCHSEVRCRVELPHLVTIHGNGEPGAFGPRHVFVSRDHMERMGGRHFVHNGLDPGDFEYREDKEDWLLFLSKARWSVKGVDRAERIAKRSGDELVIAGGRRFNWSRRITSVGMVDDDRKRGLLAGARGLLFPVRWEEPFGLVVIEALASGTPVLASRRGSMPELVSDDVGVLCETEDDFVEALGRVDAFDPAACRRRVEERFSARRMAEDYLALYRRLLAGQLEPDDSGSGAGGSTRGAS